MPSILYMNLFQKAREIVKIVIRQRPFFLVVPSIYTKTSILTFIEEGAYASLELHKEELYADRRFLFSISRRS